MALLDSQKPSYVFNFTIRDTDIDFINVSCWGSQEFIESQIEKLEICQTSGI
jgi:hypothetical protein